jgi:hypothetical protein
MECITATKTNLKPLFSLKSHKQGKRRKNQIYHLHIKNTLSFFKNAKFKRYLNLAAYNTITANLNDEEVKNKRCRNQSELDEYKERLIILKKYKTKQQVLLEKQSKTNK